LLTDLRGACGDKITRKIIQDFSALHRTTFMGERQTYYNRIAHAGQDSDNVMSCIMDGMAQTHCSIPWEANQHNFGRPLKQHLQGVLEHHKIFVSTILPNLHRLISCFLFVEVIYRTFHNLRNDSQVAIHVLLLQLERFYNRHQCFPKIFYHQIDGGPENANQYMLAICELLVALGIVEKVVLTRLPVGHTHEDIDARYFSHTRGLSLSLSPLLPTHSQAHTRAQIHTHTHTHAHTHTYTYTHTIFILVDCQVWEDMGPFP
jgi:hypothetical protein